jgi:hypothetical protein
MSREGPGGFLGRVRVVQAAPEPSMGNLHTCTILSHIFSMSPELSLILACLKYTNTLETYQ